MESDVYRDARGEWRWRIIAENGEIVAASTEGYKTHEDCIANHDLVTTAGVSPMFSHSLCLISGFVVGVLVCAAVNALM